MALLPPEDEYQNRVNDAWMNHVAGGLRSELKGDDIPADAAPHDVIRYYRDTYAGDSSPAEFESFLTDTYGKGFKAPPKTLGEKTGEVVRGTEKAAPSIGQQIAGQVGAQAAAKMAGKSVWKLGGPALGGAYLARLLSQIHTGNELLDISSRVPEPDMNALQKHYFDELSPGLSKQGFTTEQIAHEVQKRVHNVVRGYTATQQSLLGDVETTSQDLISSAAEGIANVGLLGYGGGFFKNALLSGARAAAGKKAASALAQKATTTLAGRLITHGVEGAGIGGIYGAVTGGIEQGAEAAARGKAPLPAAAAGAIGGGVAGAAGGAVVGGPLGAAIETVGAKAIQRAALTTPKAPSPLIEAASGTPPAPQPLQLTGVEPTTQEHPVGSKAWWEQSEGITRPPDSMRQTLHIERPTGPAAEEIHPLDIGPPTERPRGDIDLRTVEPPVQPGTNPNSHVRGVSTRYNEAAGIPPSAQGEYHPFDADKARQIAQAYEKLPKTPAAGDEEATRSSYEALNREVDAQYEALRKAGYTFEFTKSDPYKSSAEMMADLRNNKHIRVFSAPEEHHPYMTTDETNKFRAVHDVFGHGAEGFQFGPRGEDNAWRKHSQMFSPEAIPALTTETRGQNSWVNFAPGHEDLAPTDRPFAEQKAGLLPPWTYEEAVRPEVSARPGTAPEPHPVDLATEPVQRFADAVKAGGNVIEGAKVSVRPGAGGKHLVIDALRGAEHGSGASSKALDRIIATSDQHNVPLDVNVTDYAGPRGGTIPAEKIAKWYERRGFVRATESEGSISLHREPQDPTPPLTSEQIGALAEHHIGATTKAEEAAQLESFMERTAGLTEPKAVEALGNVEEGKPMIRGVAQTGQPSVGMRIGNWLDGQAEMARERINQKLGRLSAGFDPTLIGDYAVIAAAKMYRLGYTAYKSLSTEMRRDHPGIPEDAMKEIVTKARDIFQERLQGDNVTVTKLTQLLKAAEEGRPGADWYDNTATAVHKAFGADGDMFLRFLAATSAGKAADGNVTLAMKAYGQWKLGLPFDGYITNDKLHLERAVRGEVFGDRKLQSILGALRGDPNAVAIDRHVMRALGFEKAGSTKSALSDREYDFFQGVIRDLAQQRGMTPRQFQAALWTSAKIRQAQSATTPKEMSYLHSFRPYEGILKYEHNVGEGGISPLDWVNENRVTLEHLGNASAGVNKTRAGEGFTYNPYDYGPYQGNHGIVVTLASVRVPTDKLTGTEVIGFTQRFKRLLASYYGMNTGTWNLERGGEPGLSSMDLNVVLPESMRDRAIALGQSRKQRALWDLGKSEEIPTGYTGPTADAPADPKQRARWWKEQHDQINDLMEQHGVPSRAPRPETLFGKDDPLGRITSSDEYWGREADNAMPAEIRKELDAAKTPEEITNVIANREGTLAAALKKVGLSQSAENLKGDGSATDLLRYYLHKKGIDHEIVLGKNDAGNSRVWVKTKEGAQLDPSGEGMKEGQVVRDTEQPELKRGQIEAMLRTPHRWQVYTAEALGMPEEEVKKMVDRGELHPISDANMLDHVEVHKDGSVWEYVDPTPPSYNIMKMVGSFRSGKAGELLNYLDGKTIISGHDVVQNYRSQAGYVSAKLPNIEAFARKAPVAKIDAAMSKQGGYVNANEFRYTSPQGVSLWISPDGRIIRVPFHIRNADSVVQALKLKNPVKYNGPENPVLQTILNHGYVRVQLHDQSFAADATVPLSGGQIKSLRDLGRGREGMRTFAGRLVEPNGEHRAIYDDYQMGSGALNKFIAESRKGD